MKIVLIAEGSTKWDRLTRRWGVSFLIGEDVLFDVFGHEGVFRRNIRKCGIDTSRIKHIVVSHDDWDHIAGLWRLIEGRSDITVYICPGFDQNIKDRIKSLTAKVVELSGVSLIRDGLYSTGQMYGESNGKRIFEQSLILKTESGLAVITGCAHPGISNIVEFVKNNMNKNIFMVMGGFHLKDSSQEKIVSIVEKLKAFGINKIAPTHCTGRIATGIMKQEFETGFIEMKPASTIEL